MVLTPGEDYQHWDRIKAQAVTAEIRGEIKEMQHVGAVNQQRR